jgi:hypothetical protein
MAEELHMMKPYHPPPEKDQEQELTRALIVAILAAGATAAAAQRPPAAPSPAPATSPSPSASPSPSPRPSPAPSASAGQTPPDIELTANVRWRELRFDEVGTPKVEFSGNPTNETVWEADRENLPKPVQPGVTYRDGGVRLVISTRFQELARVLDAATASPAPAASPVPSPSPSPSPAPSPRPPGAVSERRR